MSVRLQIKSLLVFGVFLLSILISFKAFSFIILDHEYPYAVEERINEEDEYPAPEVSADTFIVFDNMPNGYRAFDKDNVNKQVGKLKTGSVVQLPREVTVYVDKGNGPVLDLNKSIQRWKDLAAMDALFTAPLPQYRTCRGLPRSKCNPKEPYFPVDVFHSSDNSLSTERGRNTVYFALNDLIINEKENFRVMRGDQSQMASFVQLANEPSPGDVSAGGEVTVPLPQTRPAELSTTPAIEPSRANVDCRGMKYQTDINLQHAESCLRHLSLKDKVELVMQDILEINRRRPTLFIDPRVSTCIAWREGEGFLPNAANDTGRSYDRGMYQVAAGTTQVALNRAEPVVEGFKEYANRPDLYRKYMIESTLAQADLHHMVMQEKARYTWGRVGVKPFSLLNKIKNNRMEDQDWRNLIALYHGRSERGLKYGNDVIRCYKALKKLTDKKTGTVRRGVTSDQLQRALHKATARYKGN